MTANLTVPADVWACQQPGVPLVAAIVEGEHASDYIDRTNVVNPPAWLVALRDARCETCGGPDIGSGTVQVHTGEYIKGAPVYRFADCPNDRCHDGRLLHDVRVEMIPYSYHGDPCPCELPADEHYRTVRCLIDFAEVRALPTAGVCKIEDDHLDVYGTEPVLYVLGGHDGELTPAHVDALAAACGKPPADWPGGYAVILITTDQEAE